MSKLVPFSPFLSAQEPGGSTILDRNLLALKGVIAGLATQVNQLTTIINITGAGAQVFGPIDATYITQTPNTALTGEQALSLLTTGLMKNTTATGVVSIALDGTDYLSPATGAPIGVVGATYITQTPSASLSAEQALSLLATGLLKSTTATGVVSIAVAGTDYQAPLSFPAASRILVSSGSTLDSDALFTFNTTTHTFTVGAGTAINISAATGVNAVAIALPLAGAQTIEKQGTGNFSIGTLGAQVLQLYANNTAMITLDGSLLVTDYSAAQEVRFRSGVKTSWYNVDGTNFERVRAFWSGNVFNLTSEQGGTGTVRQMSIDAGTAGLTLQSNGSNGVSIGAAPSGTASPKIVCNTTGLELRPNLQAASSAGLVFDPVKVSFASTIITGATHITTATGINLMSIAAPTFDGAGGAKTIDFASTLALYGPPAGSNGNTITNAYTLWVQTGAFRLDGAVNTGGGVAAVNGQVGGAGPALAAQAKWIPINSGGTQYFIPAWT